MKGMTVRELYEALEPLLDEYGDLEVLVSYDDGFAATSIHRKTPEIIQQPMREYSKVRFEGY